MPYGKVPVLEVDGKPLAETAAIARFLSMQYGLAGKDAWEQAKVDEVAGFHRDVAMEVAPYIRVYAGFGQGDKEKLYKEVFVPGLEKHLPIYVKILKESGSGFLVKGGLTWPDFTVAEFLTTIKNIAPETLKNFPELEQYRDRVHSQPSVKKYVETRKQSAI